MKRRQRRNYRETTPWEMVAIHFMKFKLVFLFIELEKCVQATTRRQRSCTR